MSTTKKHYVNNKQFYAAICEYKQSLTTNPETRVPEYVGACISLICNKLSTKGNFSGYTYREEMIGDGIENCLAAIKGFNEHKYENPHAYFSMIAWNAFIRRISTEKKEVYIKHKNMQHFALVGSVAEMGDIENNDLSNDIIRSFEEKLLRQKKQGKVGLEKFAEVSEDDDQ